jgi:hypothetical protein
MSQILFSKIRGIISRVWSILMNKFEAIRAKGIGMSEFWRISYFFKVVLENCINITIRIYVKIRRK